MSSSSVSVWQQKCRQQHEIDFNLMLQYYPQPAPPALACASPWFRRRLEQQRWVSLVSREIPAHYPELLDTGVATLIPGDGTSFRESVAVPRRYRQRIVPGGDHHSAVLLDQLWRQRLIPGQGTEASNCPGGPGKDMLVLEDMSCVCHVFLSHGAPPPNEHVLFWLTRPCREKEWMQRTKHRIPLAVDEMTGEKTKKREDKDEEGGGLRARSTHMDVDSGGGGDVRPTTGARGLALHLTESHLPWLATFLATEFPHLEELYISLDEGRMPLQREIWLWIKSMLIGQSTLRVLYLLPRPSQLLLGSSRKMFDDDDIQAPYMEEIDSINGHEGLLEHIQKSSSKNGGFYSLHSTNKTICSEQMNLSEKGSSLSSTLNAALLSNARSGLATSPIEKSHSTSRLFDMTSVRGLEKLNSLEVLYICPSVMESLPFSDHPPARLKELYLLSNTKLQSIGTHGMEALPELEVLWIEGTCIRQLPSLSCSTCLRELHVALDLTFTTSSLEGIECIPTLEVLHLERVNVDALSFVGGCVSLRELIVHACRMFFSRALQGIERAPLEHVSLAYTDGVREINFLSRCITLRELLLTRCNGIGTSSLVGLERLPHLESLALEFTRVDSTKLLSESPSLRRLSLKNCKRILRSSIYNLDHCVSLQYLSLQDTNVINVEALYGSRSLVELDLSYCKHLEQNGVEGIVGIPTLKILRLSHTSIVSVTFLNSSTSIEELYIDHCMHVTNEGLRGLEKIPSLSVLFMTNCKANDIEFLGKCPSLEVLHISSMECLRTSGIIGIEGCFTLRRLDMSFCGVDSVSCFGSGFPNLQCLNLRGCQRLTTEGLQGLEKLPSLTELILDDLDLVSDINNLAQCASLRRLSALRCTSLTLQGVHDVCVKGASIYLRL